MSQNSQPTHSSDDVNVEEMSPPVVDESAASETSAPPAVSAVEDESTIGTGTSMALGCIAGTVVLIIFGLLFLAISRLI